MSELVSSVEYATAIRAAGLTNIVKKKKSNLSVVYGSEKTCHITYQTKGRLARQQCAKRQCRPQPNNDKEYFKTIPGSRQCL